ncbi:MAG: glyoxalase [Proteobacteria bacterium SG_bin7]|nr:MAG: glyoxalase [Proteobacteria bacterium SG_bin7]
MITGINHIQITVPKDSEKNAKSFYCEFLGLKEIPKPENRKMNGGFWLQVGNTEVHIGLEDGLDRTKTKAHVCYEVNNLDFWKKRFLEKNIEVFETLPLPNARSLKFRDPFGNRVEVLQVTK